MSATVTLSPTPKDMAPQVTHDKANEILVSDGHLFVRTDSWSTAVHAPGKWISAVVD